MAPSPWKRHPWACHQETQWFSTDVFSFVAALACHQQTRQFSANLTVQSLADVSGLAYACPAHARKSPDTVSGRRGSLGNFSGNLNIITREALASKVNFDSKTCTVHSTEKQVGKPAGPVWSDDVVPASWE